MLRFTLIFLFVLGTGPGKEYHREFHYNGKIKAQGWKSGDSKEDFWKFYYPNGKLMEQGHYTMNSRSGYWYFYNHSGKLEMAISSFPE